MVMKIYSNLASPPVRAVVFHLKNLDIPVEYVNLDVINKEHKSDEYLKINPLGTIPAIDDEGFVLRDSHAINIYLATKYPGGEKFYPTDPVKRAIVNERLFFDTGELFALTKETYQTILTSGVSSLDENVAEKFESRYAVLEMYLKENKYIAGDSVTIADFSIVATLTTMILFVSLKKDKFPILSAYLDRAEALPNYEEVNEAGLKLLNEIWKKKNLTPPLIQ